MGQVESQPGGSGTTSETTTDVTPVLNAAPQHHSEVRAGIKAPRLSSAHELSAHPILAPSRSRDVGAFWLPSFAEFDSDSTVRATTRTVARLIRAQPWWTTGLDLLDVGCRTGLLLRTLAPEAATITGVDESPSFVSGFEERAYEEGFKQKTVGVCASKDVKELRSAMAKLGKKDVCMTGFTFDGRTESQKKELVEVLAQGTKNGGHVMIALIDDGASELLIRNWLKTHSITEITSDRFVVYQKWLKIIPWPEQAILISGRKLTTEIPVEHIPGLD